MFVVEEGIIEAVDLVVEADRFNCLHRTKAPMMLLSLIEALTTNELTQITIRWHFACRTESKHS